MATDLKVTPAEHGTIRIALMGWAARCESEAVQQEGLAEHFADRPDLVDKAHRNAAASRSMAADAKALLERLR